MDHPPVTVIGLGAMGSALATDLLHRGYPTTVWNRSAGKARALAAHGAIHAPTAAEAAAASPLVILCVTDYHAGEALLDNIGDAVSGRVLVNLSTGTPDQARAMATRVVRHRADYLDGVIQAGPAQIGTPAATLLYAGPRERFNDHEATLGRLGNAAHVGADPGQACLYDMALLGLWYEAEIAYLNALTLVGAPDADPETFVPFARSQLGHVIDALPDVAREVRDRRYPAGPAPLTEHARVLDQLAELRHASGMKPDQLTSINDLMHRLIARGEGSDGFTSLIKELTGSVP